MKKKDVTVCRFKPVENEKKTKKKHTVVHIHR